MRATRPRVVVLRGDSANPWDLRAWEALADEYEIVVPVPVNNLFDTSGVRLARVPVRTAGARLSTGGRVGRLALRAVGERYVGLGRVLQDADLVHAAELGTWYTAQAARLGARDGFRLVVTVWETLPFLDSYRNVRTRPYRRQVLQTADLFLATTERARSSLLLEGAPSDRIRVSAPGVDIDRFARARRLERAPDGSRLILSVGRLVWEKGHQDVLRAVALLRRRGITDIRVLIVGVGPEEDRLRRYIDELDLGEVAQLRGWIAHDQLEATYAQASCLVLGSLPVWFWEEQFGMVLIEALAAHLPVVASSSGAIPEVVDGHATLFTPGDWVGLADVLAGGPLAPGAPGRHAPPEEYLERFSATAVAERLRAVYGELLDARTVGER